MDELFETLKYNVEIDQESLAQQLEEVRNQIDLSMGSLAFGTDRIPQASDIIGGISGGLYAAPDVSQMGGMGAENVLQTEASF